MKCFFCNLPEERKLFEDDLVMIIRDDYPVSSGHTLIIPKRHVTSWFDASDWEQQQLMAALAQARTGVPNEFSPDGFNNGVNDGAAAGQTAPHLHIHLIPRYKGDHKDARGGVRWIFPDKAKYRD